MKRKDDELIIYEGWWWKIANLTPKQKKFADEYIISGNASQSAIDAGYSAKTAAETGYENLRKPHIKEYIEERVKKIEKEKIATADEVLQMYTSILRRELYDIAQEINPLTGEVVELKQPATIKDMIKAGSELMKRYPTVTEAKKLQLEIEKLQAQIGGNEQQDDKIADFITMLKGEVQNGD